MLRLTQVQKESYVTLCMCRLTLMWILAKLLQSYWNADLSWLVFPHCSVPHLIRQVSLLSGLDCLCPSSLANCQLLSPFFSLPDWRSLPTSGHVEIAGPKPLVWFRAKRNRLLGGPPTAVAVMVIVVVVSEMTRNPFGWGCRIHRQYLCREKGSPPPKEYPGYDTKQSRDEVPVMLELWVMWSAPLLPVLPGPLGPGLGAPDKVLSMG